MKNYKTLASTIREVVWEAKLHPNQQQLDVNKNGELEKDDFAMLRAGKEKKAKNPIINTNPKLKVEDEQMDEAHVDNTGEPSYHQAWLKKLEGSGPTYRDQIDYHKDSLKRIAKGKPVHPAPKHIGPHATKADIDNNEKLRKNRLKEEDEQMDESMDAAKSLAQKGMKSEPGSMTSITRDKAGKVTSWQVTGPKKQIGSSDPMSRARSLAQKGMKLPEEISPLTGRASKNYGMSDSLIDSVRNILNGEEEQVDEVIRGTMMGPSGERRPQNPDERKRIAADLNKVRSDRSPDARKPMNPAFSGVRAQGANSNAKREVPGRGIMSGDPDRSQTNQYGGLRATARDGKPSKPSKEKINASYEYSNDEDVEQLDEKIYADDYHSTSEISQFGGHLPHVVNKNSGRTMYLGQYSYKAPKHAIEHAQAYLDGYAKTGMHGADRASRAYFTTNKQHLHMNEEAETVEESSEDKRKAARLIAMFGGKKFEEPKKPDSSSVRKVTVVPATSYGANYVDPQGADDADEMSAKKRKPRGSNKNSMKRRFNTKSYERVGGKLRQQAK